MTIGERIRIARKDKLMTQKQLGEKCKMADSAIRKYESGTQTPKIETLQRIAAALGISVLDLMGSPAADAAQADIDQLTGSVQADSDILTRGIDPVKEAERWRKENHEMVDALNVYGTASAHDFLEFLTKDMKNTDKTKE